MFTDLVNELVGSIPRLPQPHAAQIINKSWSEIRQLRLWSFLTANSLQLFVPAAVQAGTISPTFGLNTIAVDATAAAAFNALGLNPPLAGVIGVGRQIRVGSLAQGGTPTNPMYSILSWDSVNTLTIDRPYGETTGTLLPYQVVKAYYVPPVADFVRYFSITNASTGYTIRGKRLYYTEDTLNAIDPQRGGQGDAYILAYWGTNSLGQPVHELYPNPVNPSTYLCFLQRRLFDLSPSIDLPPVPYGLKDLLLDLSKMHAAEWALANVGTYPELAQTNWVAYTQLKQAGYKENRMMCIKQDDEISPLIPFLQGTGYDFPLGGAFLQGHDVSSLISG